MDVQGYKIGQFYLDLNKKQLFKDEQAFDLHERSLQFLILLAQSSPSPMSKKSLHEALWPQTVVSDWSLSRLVSDTRLALGDDGEQQSLIKTVRGQGFCINDVEVVSRETVRENKRKKHLKTLTYFITFIVFISISSGWYSRYQSEQTYAAISRVKAFQDGSFVAFKAQIKRRTQLTQLLENRLNIKRTRQFEMFFEYYADQMNMEEKFVCQQMRAFSDTGLFKNNSAVLAEIEAHPAIIKEIPLTNELAQHLRIWIDKYNSVFKVNQNMCLVYVGVEDGVPYPSEVDQQIKQWLLKYSAR